MFHTIAIDSRGHGESKSKDEEYTINQFSDDVINFCNAKGIGEGTSSGIAMAGTLLYSWLKRRQSCSPGLLPYPPITLSAGQLMMGFD